MKPRFLRNVLAILLGIWITLAVSPTFAANTPASPAATDPWYLGTHEGTWNPSFRNFSLTIKEEGGRLTATYVYGRNPCDRDVRPKGGNVDFRQVEVSPDGNTVPVMIHDAGKRDKVTGAITLTRHADGSVSAVWDWHGHSYAEKLTKK